MRSFFISLCLLASPALAEGPRFSTGGFLVGVQYGPGFWHLDQEGLAQQLNPYDASVMTGIVQNTHTLGLQLAYNILGHASVGIDFTATGWNVFSPSRGGSGTLVGTVGWHPMELIFLNKEQRPIPLDFFTYVGFGYGIVGGGGTGTSRGMDGFNIEWGLDVDWYFTRYFGVGLFAKCNFLKYGTFYYDFDNRVAASLPNSSNGTFWHTGITLRLRIGD